MKSKLSVVPLAFCFFFLSSVLAPRADAQCVKVAIFIGSVIKKKHPSRINAGIGAAIYLQNSSGGMTLIAGSKVGYAAAVKKTPTAQVSGDVSSVQVTGDIAGKFSKVVISGPTAYATKDRGVVPALIQISASKIKEAKSRGGKNTKNKKLTGKTAVKIIDSSTGKVLYNQRPCKFSKLCTFAYQWEQSSCSVPNGNPGVKR